MILQSIKALLGATKVADTAVDFVRKLGGLDELTDKEKLDAALAYLAATKHQSPTRRFIALAFVIGFMLFTFGWLVSTVAFRLCAGLDCAPALSGQLDLLSDDILGMLKEVILQPVNLVIGFYFVISFKK